MPKPAAFWQTLKGLIHPLRASTRRFFQIGRESHKSFGQLIHGYAYARWPYDYIGSAIAEKPGLKWRRVLFAPFLLRALFPQRWAEEYHGKVVPLESAKRLVTVQENLSLPQPEQVIPFAAARSLILEQPTSIALLDCPCRLAREHPCLPLDVCLIVGEPFASFILEHHPRHARAITQSEALTVLEEEAKRGHVHHAFFKHAMLDRFYAICNCCSCCCGAMAAQRAGTPMLISSGYISEVNPDKCKACGECARKCPFKVIDIKTHAVIDREGCMGCGVCVQSCPNGALILMLAEEKPLPLELRTR
ncbi:MAG: 4Fe-4S dicluster domain-containing protein [Anaerolineae bacterium]